VAERLSASSAPDGREAVPVRTILELQDATQIGDVLIRSLIRAQLGLAVRMVVAVGSVLAGLPALFALAPGLERFNVFGLPIAWLLLGVALFPFLGLSGWIYNRVAERHEREFADLVERP
jgi:hypothetical protein